MIMKQVNSSTSGRLWDKIQQSPYYHYQVRLFTSYQSLVFIIVYFHNYIFESKIFYQFSYRVQRTDCCLHE